MANQAYRITSEQIGSIFTKGILVGISLACGVGIIGFAIGVSI